MAPKASSPPSRPVLQLEPQHGLRPDRTRRRAVDVGRGAAEPAQRHPPRPHALALGHVGVRALRRQRHHRVAEDAVGADAGAHRDVGRVEAEADHLDAEGRRHLAGQHLEEAGEVGRLEQRQAGPVHLVHAGDVVVGRRQHLAVGVLEPVEPVLQPLDQHPAQVDDVAAAGAAVGGEERAHQCVILEDQARVAEDLLADFVRRGLGGFHARPLPRRRF